MRSACSLNVNVMNSLNKWQTRKLPALSREFVPLKTFGTSLAFWTQ
jgi:hypothetical protein